MDLPITATPPSAQIVLEEEGMRCGCTDNTVCTTHLDEAVEEAYHDGYIDGHQDGRGT